MRYEQTAKSFTGENLESASDHRKRCLSEIFARSILTVVGLAIMLIPTGLFWGLWALMSPETFFQKFAMLALGIIVFGSFQLWLLLLIGGWLILKILEPLPYRK